MSIIWHKVRRDLWRNKLRTFLIVLSTGVGVFSLGFVYGTSDVLQAKNGEGGEQQSRNDGNQPGGDESKHVVWSPKKSGVRGRRPSAVDPDSKRWSPLAIPQARRTESAPSPTG